MNIQHKSIQEAKFMIVALVFIYSSDQITSIDEQSGSIIKLNNGIILYLREVNKFLALVCILREYNFTRQGIIDYNFLCLHDAIHKIFAVRLSKNGENFVFNQTHDDDSQQGANEPVVVANGHGHVKQSYGSSNHASNAQLTNYLLNTKFRKGIDS